MMFAGLPPQGLVTASCSSRPVRNRDGGSFVVRRAPGCRCAFIRGNELNGNDMRDGGPIAILRVAGRPLCRDQAGCRCSESSRIREPLGRAGEFARGEDDLRAVQQSIRRIPARICRRTANRRQVT